MFRSFDFDMMEVDAKDATSIEQFKKGMIELLKRIDPTREAKKPYNYTLIAKKVLRAGSIDLLNEVEEKYKVPLLALLQKEVEKNKEIHEKEDKKEIDISDQRESYFYYQEHRDLMFELIYSYNVKFVKYLIDSKKFNPTDEDLKALVVRGYDNGSSEDRFNKIATHAYIWSLIHPNEDVKKTLLKLSDSSSLSALSTEELFLIFSEYTKQFKVSPQRFEYHKFIENSQYIASEISKRNLKKEDFISIATMNNGQYKNALLYYLTISGEGIPLEAIKDLFLMNLFDMNQHLDDNKTPLSLAIQYGRVSLAPYMVAAGANFDAVVDQDGMTPVALANLDDALLKFLPKKATCFQNTLAICVREIESELLVRIIKHLDGNLEGIDLKKILISGAIHSHQNLYNLLIHLNEDSFKQASAIINSLDPPDTDSIVFDLTSSSHDIFDLSSFSSLKKTLNLADEFKKTNTTPKGLELFEKETFLQRVANQRPGPGCMGMLNLFVPLMMEMEQHPDRVKAALEGEPEDDISKEYKEVLQQGMQFMK